MAVEFLNELENKIDALVETVKRIKEENVRLGQQLEQANGRISDLENQNRDLNNELGAIRSDAQGRQEKLDVAAERIQGLIAKLETVQ